MTDSQLADCIIAEAQTPESQQRADELLEQIKNGERTPAEMVFDLKEEDILKVLKASYIAERFFKKSRSWFCHKLNHDEVNGKRADFTQAERAQLKDALDTIAYELQILSDKL